MPGPMLNRFKCWQHLLFLHCSHVYCFPEWQKTRTCAAEFDAPLDWGDVIGGHTVVGLKIQGRDVWLKFCSFIYIVVVIKCCLFFFPFCLFVCVFHNDHNSNSRCPFLHCWHAINTSSSAHLSSYLFLFSLSVSLYLCLSLFLSLSFLFVYYHRQVI